MAKTNNTPKFQRSLLRRSVDATLKIVVFIALSPLILPTFIIFIVPSAAYIALLCIIQQRRWKRHLRSLGRTISHEELREKLKNCEGTLIEEFGPKGPSRVWWTEDDLLRTEDKPPSDDEVWDVLAEKVRSPFNVWCCKYYIDDETGKARLTNLSPKQVVKLAREFPTMKTVYAVPFAAGYDFTDEEAAEN